MAVIAFILGVMFGVFLVSIVTSGKMADYERDIYDAYLDGYNKGLNENKEEM